MTGPWNSSFQRFKLTFKFQTNMLWKWFLKYNSKEFLSKTKVVGFQQMKNFWIPNLLKIPRSTTLVLDKNSFELYFRNYFQSRIVWNLTDNLNLWTLRFKGLVILCSNFYFLSLISTRLWFNMILERRLFDFIYILTLVYKIIYGFWHMQLYTYICLHT